MEQEDMKEGFRTYLLKELIGGFSFFILWFVSLVYRPIETLICSGYAILFLILWIIFLIGSVASTEKNILSISFSSVFLYLMIAFLIIMFFNHNAVFAFIGLLFGLMIVGFVVHIVKKVYQEKEMYSKAVKVITKTKQVVLRAKQMGLSVRGVRNSLDEAEQLIKCRKYDEAFQICFKIEKK